MSEETSMAKDVHYEFGRFRLLPSEQQLLHDGCPIPLTYKAFRTLLVLIANDGHLVEKAEIMAAVWKDAVIEEGNLAVTISMIRKALGDTRKPSKYIQTVVKRGYRFIGVAHHADAETRSIPVYPVSPGSEPSESLGSA
jgi:DNA-binding winged helix-turn-helix (wHTH) protein